jgi:adenosylhomocysteine nucleosidase
MLLRWLVNQYLQDGAQGKVRQAVSEFVRGATAPTNHRPPTTDRPTTDQPATDQPTTDQPTTDQPTTDQPTTDQPTTDQPASEYLPTDVVFLFALGIEAGGLVDSLKGMQTARQPHGVEHAGKLAGREVVIVEAGVGVKAAARATTEAIKFYQPRWIVSAGFAGALDERLHRGHILMADEVANPTGERLDVGMKLQTAGKGLHVGRLLTVSDIVRRPEDRRRLAAEHGAIACDMETFGVARACAEQGVRLLSVRIISDALDDELPPEVENLLEQKTLAGKIGAAAGAVLKRFGAAKDLWRLREDALKASDRLAKFLAGVVGQLP